MPGERQGPRITIDDLAESAASGVLRALQARQVSAADFTNRNGFFININLTAGGPGIGGVLGSSSPGNMLPDQPRELPQ
jgi:hypothetical protein